MSIPRTHLTDPRHNPAFNRILERKALVVRRQYDGGDGPVWPDVPALDEESASEREGER